MVADAHFKFTQRWCPRCRQLLSDDDDDNGLCDVNDIILLFFLAYILSIPKCKAEQFLLWYLFANLRHSFHTIWSFCWPLAFPTYMSWNVVCVVKLVLIVDLAAAYDMAQPVCNFLFLYPAFLVRKIQNKDKTGWLHSFCCLLFHMLKSFTCYMTKNIVQKCDKLNGNIEYYA